MSKTNILFSRFEDREEKETKYFAPEAEVSSDELLELEDTFFLLF